MRCGPPSAAPCSWRPPWRRALRPPPLRHRPTPVRPRTGSPRSRLDGGPGAQLVRIYAGPLAAPELDILGHFWAPIPVPGAVVEGVGAGVVAAAKRAARGAGRSRGGQGDDPDPEPGQPR